MFVMMAEPIGQTLGQNNSGVAAQNRRDRILFKRIRRGRAEFFALPLWARSNHGSKLITEQ